MAKMNTYGKLRLRRLKRINKNFLINLNKKEEQELNDYIEKIIWRMKATDGTYEKRKTIRVYAPHPTKKDRDTFIVWNELKEVPEYFITERDKVFNNTSVRERLAVEIANLYYDEDVTDTLPWE